MLYINKIIPHGLREAALLSFRSIWRNKTRSTLTMLGLIIGVGSVILLVSLGQGLQSYITNQFEQLGANQIYVLPGNVEGFSQGGPSFSTSKLTMNHVNDISKLGGPIKAVAADNESPAAVKYRNESKYTTVAGVSYTYPDIMSLEISEGRTLTRADENASRKIAVLGSGIVEDLFGATKALGKEVTIAEEKFEVVGIIEEIGTQSIGFDIDNFVAVPVSTFQIVFGTDSIQSIIVQATSKETIEEAKEDVENYLLGDLADDEFSVIDQSSLLDTINSILGVVTAALGGIAAISLVVGGVGIMNIMLVSVTERTREIGLRKAIGAKPNDILTQFLIEAVVLSVTGGAVGILIGWAGSLAINQFFPAGVTLWSVMLSFGVSALVGIVFGVAPAIRASRLDPIQALRYE